MLRSIISTCNRLQTKYIHSGQLLTSTYKSQHSLDNLYPNKLTQYGSEVHVKDTGEDFSGFVPIDELDIRYSRSSGPGGQHVNKVNTKVEIRFHVESAKWIPDWIKPKLMEKETTRITKDGYLIVTSEKTRKQLLNQADCLEKIRALVWQCAIKQQLPTQEQIKRAAKRKEKANKERLRQKREHAYKKQLRGSPTS